MSPVGTVSWLQSQSWSDIGATMGQHESSGAPLLTKLTEGASLELGGQMVQGRFNYLRRLQHPNWIPIRCIAELRRCIVNSNERGDSTATRGFTVTFFAANLCQHTLEQRQLWLGLEVQEERRDCAENRGTCMLSHAKTTSAAIPR